MALTTSVRLLFDLCFILSLGLATFVYRKNRKSWLNRYFALAALSLFAWLFTLYLYDAGSSAAALTLLGRINFTAVLFVALLGYLFVTELTGYRPHRYASQLMLWETSLLALLTLFTPLVDRTEAVSGMDHVTTFGPLFWIYALHVTSYLAAGIVLAVHVIGSAPRRLRRQLATIVFGMLVSAAIGIYVDIALPFGLHDFRYQDVGALAAVIYFGSMAYAITAERLFDVRLVVRRAFVLTALVALATEVYELALDWLTKFLPVQNYADRHLLATMLVLTLNVVTQDRVRHLLSRLFDRVVVRSRIAVHSEVNGRSARNSVGPMR